MYSWTIVGDEGWRSGKSFLNSIYIDVYFIEIILLSLTSHVTSEGAYFTTKQKIPDNINASSAKLLFEFSMQTIKIKALVQDYL